MWTYIKKLFSRKKKTEEIKTEASASLSVYDNRNPLEDDYLFNFLNYASDVNSFNGTGNIIMTGDSVFGNTDNQEKKEKKKKKIKIKPIDVLEHLETVPTHWSMTLLDDKIKMLEFKEELITQHYAKREVTALIERMKNRKKYKENKEFFERFPNTNDEKIGKLLEKYDLVMKTSEIFIPEFPDDAIQVMMEYTEAMKKVCDKKPIFYVIAEPDKFRKAYEKRDPILLVQSPFGFY